MKPKKLNKKLSLNKTTIADIGNNVMSAARGGVATDNSCYITERCNTEFDTCTDPQLCQCTNMCTVLCPATWQIDCTIMP